MLIRTVESSPLRPSPPQVIFKERFGTVPGNRCAMVRKMSRPTVILQSCTPPGEVVVESASSILIQIVAESFTVFGATTVKCTGVR